MIETQIFLRRGVLNMREKFYTTMKSPIGGIALTSYGEGVCGIYTSKHPLYSAVQKGTKKPGIFKEAVKQLEEYFEGKRKNFDVTLSNEGTKFQSGVWKALTEIPYGSTKSYGEIAKVVKNPKASRAVGLANNKNPICIIVPCHRVIGSSGKLTGYAGGIKVKKWLLDHEAKIKGLA